MHEKAVQSESIDDVDKNESYDKHGLTFNHHFLKVPHLFIT